MEKPIPKEVLWYPSGCDLLDTVLAGDKDLFGYQGGMIYNIVGDKSSGKSFLCYEAIAASRYKFKDDFRWVYDNCESSSVVNSQKLYGFDIMNEDMPRSRTVEEMSTNIRRFIRSLKPGEKAMYVVDSLDGLASDELVEMSEARQKASDAGKDFDDASYQMGSAKFLSQEFFRTLAREISDTQCVLIIISQLRENVGGGLYAPKFKRAGGKALDFYAHSCLWLSNLEMIEKKERAIGVVIKAEAKKSKTPRPYRECMFTILFEYGIDNVSSNLDYVYSLRGKRGELPTKKEAKPLMWEGEEFSRDSLINYIDENHFKGKLRGLAIDKWEAIEDSIKIDRPSKYGDGA